MGATKTKPTIEIGEQLLFTVFDEPRLLKSLQNNFMNKKLQFVVEGKYFSWTDVTNTYIDERSITTRTMLRNYALSHFSVKLSKDACKIFFKIVAAPIIIVVSTKQLNNSTSLNTVEFIENINKIFDSLNSRVLQYPNPFKGPLSIYTSIDTLEKGIKYFQSIDVLENNKIRNNIYCFEGFQWTLTSISLLWENVKSQRITYLLTSFLNSVIKNRDGYNSTLIVRQCQIAIQQNINIRLQMATDTGIVRFVKMKHLILWKLKKVHFILKKTENQEEAEKKKIKGKFKLRQGKLKLRQEKLKLRQEKFWKKKMYV
ncbi:unnamed protein product [Psylliodes chrysocephalus]|uniref:Transposable element P transposase-like GTP-binding insertion domain-containing protein n=1 Tax=Psylliodes chrysocephalus TaxID=3402493 RepID=A0A9P0CVA7_9CUCU|nr:unnamed protein product [Psylliodes chrysocephala]